MPLARPGRPAAPHSSAALRCSHALALGLLHGPAEMLPISSSAHMELVPWLACWPDSGMDAELRKALEVYFHVATALALLVGARGEVLTAVREADARRVTLMLAAVGVPGVVGLALERPIERRLGSPRSIAAALLSGSAAMVLADRRAVTRTLDQAGAVDGLLLGVAQTLALAPGVSRNGATLCAARARGYGRADAASLSRAVAFPVIAGAATLKGSRVARRRLAPGIRRALVVGGLAAGASTMACLPLQAHTRRGTSLYPYAGYRTALALLVIRRLRDNGEVTPIPSRPQGRTRP